MLPSPDSDGNEAAFPFLRLDGHFGGNPCEAKSIKESRCAIPMRRKFLTCHASTSRPNLSYRYKKLRALLLLIAPDFCTSKHLRKARAKPLAHDQFRRCIADRKSFGRVEDAGNHRRVLQRTYK